jgi:acyl carrier protein
MTVSQNEEAIEEVILAFIREQFPAASQVELTTQTHLFREGVVDSIGILLLVRMLEERFSLSVDPAQMVLANFETVRAMGNFVRSS